MNLADLQTAIALGKQLAKIERKRAKLLRALAALGIDITEFEAAAGRPEAVAGEGSGVAATSSAPGVERFAQERAGPATRPAPITEAELEEQAVKAVMTAAYASWQSGEITDEDFFARKARYGAEIAAARAEILAGPKSAEPCAICEAPSTLIVMGDHFCAAHRPKPLQVVAQ